MSGLTYYLRGNRAGSDPVRKTSNDRGSCEVSFGFLLNPAERLKKRYSYRLQRYRSITGGRNVFRGCSTTSVTHVTIITKIISNKWSNFIKLQRTRVLNISLPKTKSSAIN